MTVNRNEFPQEPIIEFLYYALVCPLTYFDLVTKKFDGGVFYQDRSYCSTSRQIKSGYYNIQPDISKLDSKDIAYLDGAYVYGGMLQNRHFGHFLVESISRLWAVSKIKHCDGVVFYLRSPDKAVSTFIYDFFSCILPEVRIIVVDKVTEVRELIVPSQMGMPKSGYIVGHKVFEDVFNNSLELQTVSGFDKIYVSRSRLDKDEGAIVCEDFIENFMKREGYAIVHPQDLSIYRQIEIYKSCRKAVFADGSALHLFSLFSHCGQDVFVIWRRSKPVSIFYHQLRTFSGISLKGVPALIGYFKEVGGIDRPSRRKVVLDYAAVAKQLASNNFIYESKVVVPNSHDIRKYIENLQCRNNRSYEFKVCGDHE